MSIFALLKHENIRARELGYLLSEISIALTDKTITEQEYVTLMIDTERLKKVIELSEDQELKLKVNAAFKVVIELAKLVKP